MFKKLIKLFKSGNFSDFQSQVDQINALESEIEKFSSEEILNESERLRKQARGSADASALQLLLNKILPRAFALVRETAKRTLGQRHYDVQLMGGIALNNSSIAEMRTGEGKTLAATLPVYLNAVSGKGVHVVTVNEYLAKRDTVWMGQIYYALGMSVGCLVHDGAFIYDPEHTLENKKSKTENQAGDFKSGKDLDKDRDIRGGFLVHEEFLRPVSRKEAYDADITHGTNHEFGFDYLRDNLVHKPDDKVQKEHNFAIIDEVDSILIDEARTPLIIAAPDTESSQHYKTFARIASGLRKEEDYSVDEKAKSVYITESGIDKVERAINVKNIYAPENLRLTHYLIESLKAKELFLKDKDYVVKDGSITLVDQFTGRLMMGRRYSGGLHQAIEAKEGVRVNQESRTYASISIQNYFRMYKKLAGMTGTAQTSAEEFHKVYGLEVVTIPTHKPTAREDMKDFIYKTRRAKYDAIVKDVRERNDRSQPVLIGTVSIEKNEELSGFLNRAGLKHEVLNAKNNEREGAIIAQAGRPSAITVATNMAGRGVDIMLGGPSPAKFKNEGDSENRKVSEEYKRWEEEREIVIKAHGLHVIGTERHESRRIDNQLRGRAGRQGDVGSSQFFLSLEDDLMRIFGGERIKNLMETLKVPDEMPIQSKLISRSIEQAQSKVEGINFDSRKHLLDYDDVLNKQRLSIYRKRDELLATNKIIIRNRASKNFGGGESSKDSEKEKEISFSKSATPIILFALDNFWMNHLENMEALQESVRLRAYGQHDPLVEYRKEGHFMFQSLLDEFEAWVEENKDKIRGTSDKIIEEYLSSPAQHKHNSAISHTDNKFSKTGGKKIGRNEPCPCNSGKKYKKCHMTQG